MRVPLAAISFLILSACNGGGGPSAADLSRIYGFSIELISCAKASESVYRCRFKFANPPTVADRGEHTQCFVTDGSRWEIKIFC